MAFPGQPSVSLVVKPAMVLSALSRVCSHAVIVATLWPHVNRRITYCGNYFCGYNVGMSRPKNAKADQRENVLRIRLTDAERKKLDAAAEARTLDTSTWARAELLQLAKRKA
jgi:hypothetical protein